MIERTVMGAVIYLPNHPNGAGWYFFNEDWSEVYGPYADEVTARLALMNYVEESNAPTTYQDDLDTESFWLEEYNRASEGEVHYTYTPEQIQKAWDEPRRSPTIYVEQVSDLYNLDGLIDGGYLSFVYGSRKGNFGGWGTAKFQYSNYLILMDSGGVRIKEYEPYKSRRNERRDQYDYMRETYEAVKQFRTFMLDDPLVKTSYLEGYEADDLIALLFLKGIGTDYVIAQDKDMFMVSGLREKMFDHNGIAQYPRGLKLPKYAIKPKSPGSWAFTQALFGDKSDSIPRLLPSRTGYKQEYSGIVKQARNLLEVFYNAYYHYGEQFLVNLRLVLLPHPSMAKKNYDDYNLLFIDVAKGTYWDPNNYSDDLLEAIVRNMKVENW